MRRSWEGFGSSPAGGLPLASSLVLAFALLVVVLLLRPSGVQASRPNFVVIQTDDQTLDSLRASYRTNGGRIRPVMPNARRLLIRSGFEFSRAHAPSPLCAPSRASLLTGRYPHNTGLLQNGGTNGGWSGWEALPSRERNLPVALEGAGYRTIHIGKFTNAYRAEPGSGFQREVPPGWSRWFTVSDSFYRGYDRTRYYGYRLNVDGRITRPFRRTRAEDEECWFGQGPVRRGRPACSHLTDRTTLLATGMVRPSRRPFFLALNYSAPHTQWIGRKTYSLRKIGPEPSLRHRKTATRTPLPRPPSFNEADVSDKPRFIRSVRRLRRDEIQFTTSHYRRYLESLRGVDQGIGALIAGLRRSGELNDTYIFFTSDNGLFFGEHRFGPSKGLPYQSVLRIPLVVRGPEIPSGRRSSEAVSLIDIAPTIARLANVRLGYRVDGRDLEPFWRTPSKRTDRPLLSEVGRIRGATGRSLRKSPPRQGRAIRIGRWRLARYERGGLELYDLKGDPDELRNLAELPRYGRVVRYLNRSLTRYQRCDGAECREALPVPRPPTGR